MGEWPDDPSFRFLVHWALRREELRDPGLCPDAPDDDGQRCDCAEKGLLILRALDLMGALKLGVAAQTTREIDGLNRSAYRLW